jgi:hypothetical protein|mmetsp:Transcript_390/g.1286  ORF Transcript_390/g.1286 Transcript_390/m.1286 type:complete len:80 (+) Transcript_390:824-1063(+)
MASFLKLPDTIIVTRHCKPTHRVVRILLDQLLRTQVKLTFAAKLNSNAEEARNSRELKRISLENFRYDLVATMEITTTV